MSAVCIIDSFAHGFLWGLLAGFVFAGVLSVVALSWLYIHGAEALNDE